MSYRGYLGPGRRNPRRAEDPYSFFSLQRLIRYLSYMGYTVDEIIDYILYDKVPETPETPDRPDPRPDRPDPRPDRPDPRPDRPSKPDLEVKSVDLQVASNTQAHHTDEYDITESSNPSLVVRRGQPFSLKIRLSRALPAKDHDLRLIFETGTDPKESKGSRASFKVSDGKPQEGKWSARFLQKSGDSVEISVLPPPRCIVGKWRWTVQLLKTGQTQPLSAYRAPKPIYVLFNPWCKEDVVYNDNEEELQGYVLQETGKLWYGNAFSHGARSWNFGQFTDVVLDCTLDLLDRSGLKMDVRGDPVMVVRKLSGLVNSNDDNGILAGNWSGNYGNGTSPSKWTGSVKILQEYHKTKTAVKYGQCWVFAGVLTTVCRTLGILCRSVTNFASAHDTDVSVTIDKHFSKDGQPLRDSDEDSIWNFHVWNEVWMRRDDLKDGYGGWQACDATPQEASEGLFQCGPCPVRAIKEGDLEVKYDAPFIFAEVNADVVYWKWHEVDNEYKATRHDRHEVGKKMSTLALKKDNAAVGDRNDVTDTYKYKDGSPEERAAVMRAHSMASSKGKEYSDTYDSGPKDVDFKLDFDPETPVGQEFMVKLTCKNTSRENRTVNGRGSISTMFYTGVVAEQVAVDQFKNVKLTPGASQVMELRVSPFEYQRKLEDGCFLSFTMVGLVTETQQSSIHNDTVMLKKPLLKIKGPKEGRVGEEFEVTVTLSNPLDTTLTDCNLEVEGPGITKFKEYPQGDVAAKGTLMAKLKLKPYKKNRRTVVVVFTSKQLDNISESHEIFVKG